jgi:hypothetical protein
MMCVLLLFNDTDTLSYADIETHTDIASHDLKRTLQSLACGKFKLLTKEPRSREVGEEDTFAFNDAFTSKQLRFKVRTPSTLAARGGDCVLARLERYLVVKRAGALAFKVTRSCDSRGFSRARAPFVLRHDRSSRVTDVIFSQSWNFCSDAELLPSFFTAARHIA